MMSVQEGGPREHSEGPSYAHTHTHTHVGIVCPPLSVAFFSPTRTMCHSFCVAFLFCLSICLSSLYLNWHTLCILTKKKCPKNDRKFDFLASFSLCFPSSSPSSPAVSGVSLIPALSGSLQLSIHYQSHTELRADAVCPTAMPHSIVCFTSPSPPHSLIPPLHVPLGAPFVLHPERLMSVFSSSLLS